MRRLALAAAASLLAAACGMPGMLVPESDVLRDVHLRGSPAVPTVALTFDDGPNGRCTAAVLDALAAAGAPATFFVLGTNVAAPGNAGLLGRMVREGHEIGTHGYWHGVRRLFWQDLTEKDLAATTQAIDAALVDDGVPPPLVRFFRPPFGFLLPQTAHAASAAHVAVVEWTVSVHDWRKTLTGENIAAAVLSAVRPGDIVLLHDGNGTHQRSAARCTDRQAIADAIPLLVQGLRARGLEPAPLATVLGFAPLPGHEPFHRPLLQGASTGSSVHLRHRRRRKRRDDLPRDHTTRRRSPRPVTSGKSSAESNPGAD